MYQSLERKLGNKIDLLSLWKNLCFRYLRDNDKSLCFPRWWSICLSCRRYRDAKDELGVFEDDIPKLDSEFPPVQRILLSSSEFFLCVIFCA